ncbi:MAG: DUF4301 family protein [Crocinitomicaceae bacterium]
MELTEKIDIQRRKIKDGNPNIDLVGPCTIEDGILKLSDEEVLQLKSTFKTIQPDLDICFFTPASGSGSRMFKVFFEYLSEPYPADADALCERSIGMLDNLDQLPIRSILANKWIEQLEDGGVYPDELIANLISPEGLNLSAKPKGLIPFHYYEAKTLNPFQEHLIQSEQIGGALSKIHFTINKDFQDEIEDSLAEISTNLAISFSEQDPGTHSVAFDEDLNPAKDNSGNIILRPSGHGALINNLNQVDSDIILIRNIDNIQHQKKAFKSELYRSALSAKLIEFRDEVFNVLSKLSRDHSFESSIKSLNDKYDLKLSEKEMTSPTSAFEALNRPIRICGMVKNEGEPGGGPFWVKDDHGKVSRQIIEKSQISDRTEDQAMVSKATHFNPVELFCSVRDFKGNKFNLLDFVNENQYFLVQKTQDGQAIQYIEQPGLWNGAMANWLTLFVEIDSACFSPVKSVLDLLQEAHRG